MGDRSRVHLSLDVPREDPVAAAAAAHEPLLPVPAPEADLIAAMEAATLEAGGVQGPLPVLASDDTLPTHVSSPESGVAGTDVFPSALAPSIAQQQLLGAPGGKVPVPGQLLAGQPLRISFSRPCQAPGAAAGAAEGADNAARGGEVAPCVPASVSALLPADAVPAEASPKLPGTKAQQPSVWLHRLPFPLCTTS